MTFQIIHSRGRSFKIETRPLRRDELDNSKPRLPQKPRYTIPEYRKVNVPRLHTNYRPGHVWEMGDDQCRFIPGDDHVMCGKKQEGGSSYCADHRRRTVDHSKMAKIDAKRR